MKRFIFLILATSSFLGCHVDSDRGEPTEQKLGGIANPPGTGVSWQEAGITQPPISACDAGSGIPVVSFNAGGQPYCVGVNVQYAEGGGGGGGFPCDSGVQVYDGGTFSCLPYNAGSASIACDSGVQVFDGGTYSCLPYNAGGSGITCDSGVPYFDGGTYTCLPFPSQPSVVSGEVTIGTGTGISGYATSSLSNASADYIGMGDVSANLSSVGFLRCPNMPSSSWETVAAYGTGNIPLVKYGYGGYVEIGDPSVNTMRVAASYGGAFFDLFSEDVQFGIGPSGNNYAIFSTYTPGWIIQSVNGNVPFEFSNTISGYRFVPASGTITAFSGQIGGDSTTSSPLSTGVTSGISIAGTYPLTVTPTAVQYANQVLTFTGAVTSGGSLSIALPAIVNGASGYSIVCDFTGATLTGLSSLAFKVGSSTYTVASPTTLAAYLVIWNGTTLRAVIMPKG